MRTIFFLLAVIMYSPLISAQDKEYAELRASEVLEQAMSRVWDDAQQTPTRDNLIYLINIIQSSNNFDILVGLSDRSSIPFILAGKKYSIAGYTTFNDIPAVVLGEKSNIFFKESGKRQSVLIKENYSQSTEQLSSSFQSFRWVFRYEDKALKFMRADSEFPFK